ncbi:MAG: hypothetical protein N4A46_16735 [Schleiferiaceae bacterium]|nr:hypothetical protein [Schleiferiaceae bacterium]
MKRSKVAISCALLFLFGCEPSNDQEFIKAHYKVYKQHDDFNLFLSHYSKNASLVDVVTGDSIYGHEDLKHFFQWNDSFEFGEEGALDLYSLESNKGYVHAHGQFLPFSWKGENYPAMEFYTTFQIEKGKIIYQRDSIVYPEVLLNPNDS